MSKHGNNDVSFNKSHNINEIGIKYAGYLLSFAGFCAFAYSNLYSKSNSLSFNIAISCVLIIVLVFYVYCARVDWNSTGYRYEFEKSDSKSINNYMAKMIKSGSRVAIWTRDMSWANNDYIKEILDSKAGKNELMIFLPKSTELTNHLKSKGAEIYEYSEKLIKDPTSRFTISNYGVAASSVAIGKTEKGKHVIEVFDSSSHPAFHLAKELVDIAIKSCEANDGK